MYVGEPVIPGNNVAKPDASALLHVRAWSTWMRGGRQGGTNACMCEPEACIKPWVHCKGSEGEIHVPRVLRTLMDDGSQVPSVTWASSGI